MESKNYIIAVDLGSSNVTVAVGEQGEDDLIEVVSVVRKPVEGVNAGLIENIELAGNAIHAAIEEVEHQLGCRITEVYAGISGEFVRCACYTDHVYVGKPQDGVSHADVDSLFSRMRNVQAPEGEKIMERVPQNYMVDNCQEVKNPVGSFGRTLSSTFNFVLCSETPLQRLSMVFKRYGITIKGVIPNVLAIPEAVLSSEEKTEGVAVVDIGGGVTDITVYYRNVIRYVATVPMGAAAINQDIRTMGVPEKYIERLKIDMGSAVAELAAETMIKVPGRTPRETKGILRRNLATVIEARAMDIAEYVQQEIKDSGFRDKLAYGIVLTGASAKLTNLDELFKRVTKMEVRVAAPDTGLSEASRTRIDDPAYATVCGLLLRGAEHGYSSVVIENPPQREAEVTEEDTAKPKAKPAAGSSPVRPAGMPAGQQGTGLPDPNRFRHVPPKTAAPAPAKPTVPPGNPLSTAPAGQTPAPETPAKSEEPAAPRPAEQPAAAPQQPAQPQPDETTAKEEPRANERTKKMKSRFFNFFGKLNGQWDSQSDADNDDTEI